MKAVETPHFGYCTLVWMFHSRGLNNKTNSVHKRVLRITFGDKLSSFQDRFKKDSPVSIHQRNVQVPATEIFKVKNNIAPKIMEELFALKMSPYDLCNKNSFMRKKVSSLGHGTESMSCIGSKI